MKARLWCTICDAPVTATNPIDEPTLMFPRDGEGWGVFEVECMDDGTCPAVDRMVEDPARYEPDDSDVHVEQGWVLRLRDEAGVWTVDVRMSDDKLVAAKAGHS